MGVACSAGMDELMAAKTLYVRDEDVPLWVRVTEAAEAEGVSASEYVTGMLRERFGEPEERCVACGAESRHWVPEHREAT
jgi:hypothetical protein